MPLDLIAVLAEPNRRRLLALLAGREQTVTQLAAEFDVSRSAISQHLGVLVEAGLVEARSEGRFRYYRLVPDGLAALRAEIDHFWTAEVEALARSGPVPKEVESMSIDRSVFVPVPPDEAFAMVTEPARLRRWQAVAARIDLRAGGDYRWRITPGHTAAGSIVEVEPGRRLVFTWGWEGSETLPPGASTVTVTLAPGDGGTFIRLVHEGLTGDDAVGHAEGWVHYLDRLVAYAADGDAGLDDWAKTPDPLDELSAAGAALAVCQQVAVAVTGDDAHKPTPCRDFDVHELVVHLLGSLTTLGAAAGGPDTAPSGGQVEDLIATAGSAAIDAWEQHGLDGNVETRGGTLPGRLAVAIIALELLVHAWDLGTAIGRPVEASDELSDYVLGLAAELISPERRDGVQFGDAIDAGADADSMARLVAFTGRRP